VVHIPLPGWVWNLERRKQWQEALKHWREIENVVILVELPPASEPEAVLLAEGLPNVLWLADAHCGGRGNPEFSWKLCATRDATSWVRCSITRRPAELKKHFSKWLACVLLLSALGSSLTTFAGETNARPGLSASVGPADEDASLSVRAPARRADWQQRLTLGAGDMLNFFLFGEPELARRDVLLGPDGRVSFWKRRRAGRRPDHRPNCAHAWTKNWPSTVAHLTTMITPGAFRSKKYYVLGA